MLSYVPGMTGKKRDFTSLPYSKIQVSSIETAGTFDLDSELDLWFSGLGRVRLEFKGQVDIRHLGSDDRFLRSLMGHVRTVDLSGRAAGT
jgi:hypothetical protein